MRRVKFTIAICALLVLALGASQAYAQAGGYGVFEKPSKRLFNTERTRGWVIIQLDFDTGPAVIIDAGDDHHDHLWGPYDRRTAGTVTCINGVDCDCRWHALEFENDEDTGAGTLTIKTTGDCRVVIRPNDQLDRYQSGRFQSGCGRRDYRHHLLHGPYRFDSHQPVETRNRQLQSVAEVMAGSGR